MFRKACRLMKNYTGMAILLAAGQLSCVQADEPIPQPVVEKINDRVYALLGPVGFPSKENSGYMVNSAVLIGDKGTCPDMIRMYTNGERHSLYRAPSESGHQFWQRVLTTARKIAKPVKLNGVPPSRTLFMPMFCFYGVPYLDEKSALKRDDLENHKSTLRRVMERDPSWNLRVKAACNMADLLWPELRKAVH